MCVCGAGARREGLSFEKATTVELISRSREEFHAALRRRQFPTVPSGTPPSRIIDRESREAPVHPVRRAVMSVASLERKIRLLCCDELGVVRVAEAAGRDKIDDLAMTKRWGDADRTRRVVRCRAGEDGDGAGDALGAPGTCAASGWLAIGRKDGTVEVIDTATGNDVGGGALTVGGCPVGVQAFGPATGRAGARLITVNELGEAVVYDAEVEPRHGGGGSLASQLAPLRVVQDWQAACRWRVGESALCARVAPGAASLAVGGKGQGNDLKVYDIETQKVTYKAKPPPQNWLGYRAPPYVSAIEFVPGTDSKQVLVGTGEHVVRLYDTRQDKRAVMDLSVGETTITAMAVSKDARFAFIGNAKGQLNTVDLRAKQVFAKFKGTSGSIREIAAHPGGEPLIAVAGLDRYLRVYNTDTRKCLGSAFMKQALSGCAWDLRGPEGEFAAAAAEAAAKRRKEKAERAAKKTNASSEKKGKAKQKTSADGSETGEKKEKTKNTKTKRSVADADDGEVVKKKKKKKVLSE